MTESPHPWDRLPTETLTKRMRHSSTIINMGARRSVRAAARKEYQDNIEPVSSTSESTIVSRWLAWSSKHQWVSRSLARDEWIARTSDEQNVANVTACKLALTTRAHDFLTSKDSEIWLRGVRGLHAATPPGSACRGT